MYKIISYKFDIKVYKYVSFKNNIVHLILIILITHKTIQNVRVNYFVTQFYQIINKRYKKIFFL